MRAQWWMLWRTELTRLDEKEPEEIQRHRADEAKKADQTVRLMISQFAK